MDLSLVFPTVIYFAPFQLTNSRCLTLLLKFPQKCSHSHNVYFALFSYCCTYWNAVVRQQSFLGIHHCGPPLPLNSVVATEHLQLILQDSTQATFSKLDDRFPELCTGPSFAGFRLNFCIQIEVVFKFFQMQLTLRLSVGDISRSDVYFLVIHFSLHGKLELQALNLLSQLATAYE